MHIPTREHVVPATFGGTSFIYVCQQCNYDRGSSLFYGPFIEFIRKDPKLYFAHVDHSKNTDLGKEVLKSLTECESQEDADNVESFITMQHSVAMEAERPKGVVRDLIRQYMALELAKNGTPLPNGRAHKARKKANRYKMKKRQRTAGKQGCREAVKMLNIKI